jgi:hypothetical protein
MKRVLPSPDPDKQNSDGVRVGYSAIAFTPLVLKVTAEYPLSTVGATLFKFTLGNAALLINSDEPPLPLAPGSVM